MKMATFFAVTNAALLLVLACAGCTNAGRLVVEWQLPLAPPPAEMVQPLREGEEPAATPAPPP